MHIQFICLVIAKRTSNVCIEACQTGLILFLLITFRAFSLLNDFNPSLFPQLDRTGL